MTDYSEFESEYQDLSLDISTATHANFSMRVKDWLAFISGTPESNRVIERLEAHFDFESWYHAGLTTGGSMVGSSRLDWSEDREARLAQYIGLFRYFAADEEAFLQFNSEFAWAGPRFDDGIDKITREYFQPFQRDLLRVIKREWENFKEKTAPASDRIVSLNDNSQDVQDLRNQMTEIELYLRSSQSNSLKADPEYIRNVAETTASLSVLSADAARTSVIDRLVIPALKWIGDKAVGTAIAVVVTATLVLIAKMFGLAILGIG